MIDCTENAVTVQWRPAINWAQKLDFARAHLGTCPPSSVSMEGDTLQFSVMLNDCGFRRQVTCLYITCECKSSSSVIQSVCTVAGLAVTSDQSNSTSVNLSHDLITLALHEPCAVHKGI